MCFNVHTTLTSHETSNTIGTLISGLHSSCLPQERVRFCCLLFCPKEGTKERINRVGEPRTQPNQVGELEDKEVSDRAGGRQQKKKLVSPFEQSRGYVRKTTPRGCYLSFTSLSWAGSRGLRFIMSDSDRSYASEIAGTYETGREEHTANSLSPSNAITRPTHRSSRPEWTRQAKPRRRFSRGRHTLKTCFKFGVQ